MCCYNMKKMNVNKLHRAGKYFGDIIQQTYNLRYKRQHFSHLFKMMFIKFNTETPSVLICKEAFSFKRKIFYISKLGTST